MYTYTSFRVKRFLLNLNTYNLYYFTKSSIDVKSGKKMIKQQTHWRVKSLNIGNNFRCHQLLLMMIL